jgi:hypothetical protein
LRVEDFHTVESISGVEHVEIRWRNATLAEAKSVVVAHQNAADTGQKSTNSQSIESLKAIKAEIINLPSPLPSLPAHRRRIGILRLEPCGERPEP